MYDAVLCAPDAHRKPFSVAGFNKPPLEKNPLLCAFAHPRADLRQAILDGIPNRAGKPGHRESGGRDVVYPAQPILPAQSNLLARRDLSVDAEAPPPAAPKRRRPPASLRRRGAGEASDLVPTSAAMSIYLFAHQDETV